MPRSRKESAFPPPPDDPDAIAGVALAALRAARRNPFGTDAAGRLAAPFFRAPPKRGRAASILRGAIRIVVLAHLWFVLSTSLCLVLFRTIDPAATTLMVYRKYDSGWKIQPPRKLALAKIPKTTRTMAIRVEDGSFYEHRGIVPAAIKNAFALNKGFGKPVYGGSTITMQTARTIFLVPEKSYLRKYLEAIVALEMEAILGKDRILELYFNYAEWGRGVFGIEAAARARFKKGAASLSRDQAMRLVTLLSSPIRYGPYDFQKSAILKARYAYLSKRYADPPPKPAAPASEPSAPAAAEPGPAPDSTQPAAPDPTPPAAPAVPATAG